MSRWFMIFASIVLLLVGAASMYVIEAGSSLKMQPSDDLSYAEFTGIILTALGVILTALTLILGALAVVGWSSIQSMVERKSEDVSREYLRDRFSDRSDEYLQLVEDLKEDVRIRILPLVRDISVEDIEEDPDA